MGKLETKHFAVIAAMLVGIGTQLAGAQHGWTDVMSPAFIGGMIVQMGTTVAAIFVGAPRDPDKRSRISDPQSDEDVARLGRL